MGLFGGKTEVELEVEPAELVAGEALVARVRLGAPDKKARAGRVELLYRNTYKYDTTDADGDTTTATSTEDVQIESVELGDEGPLQAGETTVELRVPATAPGTSPKSVDWLVRAVVDRRRGTDAKAQQPITVRVPAAPLKSWALGPAACPSECAMAFDVPVRTARPGDTIAGTVTVTPSSPVSARGLKVRLRRVRYDRDGNTNQDVVQEAVVAEGVELAAGETRSVPFSLTVPPDAPPSFDAYNNKQCWYVEAALDRKLKKDLEGRIEVVVHNA